ncbi:MAG: poly(A) polymerase [Sphingobacteriales bacterium]
MEQLPIFDVIGEVAKKLRIKTYVIGGFVRDHFLERPSKDIDFVVVGSGIDMAREVAGKLPEKPQVTVFKNFGTAMFNYQGMEIEFVGARKESYRANSRKPIVENGSLKDDQNRRDFTINAMAISLNENDFGEVLDPFRGLDHIEDKLIKTPLDPDLTFSDDPLRMMRAIRFAAQLNFEIDKTALKAIRTNAERIKIVSQERTTDELNKIILSKNPSVGFKHLFNTGLLHIIFPEMAALHGVDIIDGKGHKDNFYHTLQVLENVCTMTDDLWLRWAAILHDIAKPPTKRFDKKIGWTFHGHEDKGARMTPKIFRNLRLPLNEKMKFVQKLVALHLRPIALAKSIVTDSAIRRLLYEGGEDLDALMKLCRADITSKNEEKVTKYLKNFDLVEIKLKEVEEKDKIRNWQPPVSGNDIQDTFEIIIGRHIGDIKSKIKEAILDGDIENNREAAVEYMLKLGDEMNLKRKS